MDHLQKRSLLFQGFKALFPITPGIVPFGAIMGSICAEANLSFFQTVSMNIFVFAGASQLAAIELMQKNAPVFVVLVAGLIINLRFILYSAAYSPVVQKSNFFVKILSAYFLTDQSYAVISANEEKLKNNNEVIVFYFGAAICMTLVWQGSVMAGYVFGNFAPKSWALDYAIPLSFISLVVPALKNKKYVMVAIFSTVASIVFKPMPYNLGLITTALLAIGYGMLLTRKKGAP